MKKLLLILGLVAVIGSVNAQIFNQAISEPQTYSLTAGDTINILKADKIVSFGILVPAGATDSVWVKGGTATIDGKASGYIKLAANAVFNYTFDNLTRVDSVTIICKDEAILILALAKR